jgi:hypothetical protein
MTPPILRSDWETLTQLTSTRSKPLDHNVCPALSHPSVSFVAQPTNHSPLGFQAQNKKLSRWFWGPNHQTVVAGFEAQIRKPEATDFEAKSGETVTTSFETKPEKTVATGFEAKLEKTVPVVLRPNYWQTFPMVLRPNQETRATRIYVHGADRTQRHPTSRSSGHRLPDLCDHLRSSVLGLLLLQWSLSLPAMPHLPPAHHETSKHNSPTQNKDKGSRTTKISWIQIQTTACQWLITYQTKVLTT